MPSSSYRPRGDGGHPTPTGRSDAGRSDAGRSDVAQVRAAQRIVARQLGAEVAPRRSVDELLAEAEASELADREDPDGDLDEDFDDEFAPGVLPAAVADRLPPRLRSVRWLVGRRAVAGVVVVLVLVLAVAGVVVWRSWPGGSEPAGEPVPARVSATVPGPVATPSVTSEPAGEVVVHVAGRVLAPGLVTLSAGSRVADALAAAGGPAPDADLDALNLARPLVDGEQVLVPAPGAVVVAPAAEGGATSSVVNLNTATAAEFDTLPGVGEVLAGRIVAWREENGSFSSVEELGEVAGIGPKVLEGLRDLVTV